MSIFFIAGILRHVVEVEYRGKEMYLVKIDRVVGTRQILSNGKKTEQEKTVTVHQFAAEVSPSYGVYPRRL